MRKTKVAIFASIICLITMIGCGQAEPKSNDTKRAIVEDFESVAEESYIDKEVSESKTEDIEEVEDKTEVSAEEKTHEKIEEEGDNKSRIFLKDYTGISLPEAVKNARDDGALNIFIRTSGGEEIIEDDYAWRVSSQSIKEGTAILPVDELILTCVKNSASVLYLFSIDMENSDNDNDIRVYCDGEEISVISPGENDRFIMKTDMGDHELRFVRNDDENPAVVFTFDYELEADSIVKCVLCSKEDSIIATETEYIEDLESVTDQVPLLSGMSADKAYAIAEENKIENVIFVSQDEQIEPNNTLIVYGQSIDENNLKLKNEELILTCKTTDEYYKESFEGIMGSKLKEKCELLDVVPKIYLFDTFIEYTQVFETLTDEEKDNWTIADIRDITKEVQTVLRFDMVYSGLTTMPNVTDLKLDDARRILTENKFYDIKIENKTEVTNPNMLIVSKQNIEAGTELTGDNEIVLRVKKRILPKTTPKPTEDAEPIYTFSDYLSKMYVKTKVNVRSIPDKSGEKIGVLQESQEVSVTGKCRETGWYRIKFGKGIGYVNEDSLSALQEYVAPPPKLEQKSSPKKETNYSNSDGYSEKKHNNNTSSEELDNKSNAKVQPQAPIPANVGTTYIINANPKSKKFHKPSCGSAAKIKPENRLEVNWSREKCIEEGYKPCGNCNP